MVTCIRVSGVYSVDGWRHCLAHGTHVDSKPGVQRKRWLYLNISVDFIILYDDSMSDQTTSLSDVTGSDTRLRWIHTTQTWMPKRYNWSSVVEINWTENTDVHHINKQWLACWVYVTHCLKRWLQLWIDSTPIRIVVKLSNLNRSCNQHDRGTRAEHGRNSLSDAIELFCDVVLLVDQILILFTALNCQFHKRVLWWIILLCTFLR